MSVISATFTVTNDTGVTITNLSAEHEADVDGTDQTASLPPVASLGTGAGTTPPVSFSTESSSQDHWTISFMMDGDLKTATCTCAVDSDDANGNVVIALYQNYYSINTPVSSGCANKSYDS